MISISIVDDKPQIIRNLQAAFEQMEEVEIRFVAINGVQVLERLEEGTPHPEVILMDIEMPRKNGIEATREIRERYPDIRIVMLTVFEDEGNLFEALLAGASGYLLKDEHPQKILQALKDAREGRMPLSPALAARALSYMRQELPTRSRRRQQPEDFHLTPRETEVLSLLADGATYPEVGEKLFISKHSVRNHVHNIYQKLQVKSKAELIQLAARNKWYSYRKK